MTMMPTFKFPAPVLSVAPEAIRRLEGGEALTGLWTLFTKCKASLEHGHRLENISWRLWYREMAVVVPQCDAEKAPWGVDLYLDEKSKKQIMKDEFGAGLMSEQRPTTPRSCSPTPKATDVSRTPESLPRTSVSSSRPSSLSETRRSSFIGTMIVDMLPNAHLPTTPPIAIQRNTSPPPSASPPMALICNLSKDTYPDQPLQCQLPIPGPSAQRSVAPNVLSTPATEVDELAVPTMTETLPQVHVAKPSTPAQPPTLPRLVVVHPTPGPTPHPTPPATPVIGGLERLHAVRRASSGSGSGSIAGSSFSSSPTTSSSSVTLSEVSTTQQQQQVKQESPASTPTSMAVTVSMDSSKGKEVSMALVRRTSGSSVGTRHLSPDSAVAPPPHAGPSCGAGPPRPGYVRRTSSMSSAGGNNSTNTKRAAGRTESRIARTNTNTNKSKSQSQSRGTDSAEQRIGLTMTTTVAAAVTMTRKGTTVGKSRAMLGGGLRRTISGRGTAAGVGKEKRPTFNMGSHSDEGSALGSKSAGGSGSSVSGPRPGPGGLGSDDHQQQQQQQPQQPNEDTGTTGKAVPGPSQPVKPPQEVQAQAQPKLQSPPTIRPAVPLPDPTTALPPPQQRRTTIVLATSESDYETETDTDSESDDGQQGSVQVDGAEDDGDGDWSSEELSDGESEVVVRRGGGGGGQAPPPADKSRHMLEIQQHHQHPNTNARRNNYNHNAPTQQHISRTQQSRQAHVARAQYVVEQAALQAERLRDMFVKKPLPSMEELAGKRTRSVGLLTQLMNPDPTIFPPQHPYRRGYSYSELKSREVGVSGSGVGENASASGSGQGGAGGGERMVGIGVPKLRMSKSSAAIPVASQVQVGSISNGVRAIAGAVPAVMNGGIESRGYRPRGRPADQEMEDDSDDGSESGGDAILLSKSVAQEKLKALAQRQGIAPRDRKDLHREDPEEREPVPEWLRGPEATASSSRHQQQQRQPQQPQARHTTPTPIPVGHPYNLPLPVAPSTPRTTRRLMLQTEMSESLRRNLLWERQVSKVNLVGFRRSSSGGGGGRGGTMLGGGPLRPLTALPSMVQLTAKQPDASLGAAAVAGQQRERERRGSNGVIEDERTREERMSQALARNRSWANDFHHSGW